jgi:hypothetical protein
MANTKFSKGELVNFVRNSATKENNTPVIAVVPLIPDSGMEQTYILEYPQGWTPNAMRIQRFGLDANKKYLFVMEKELTKA